MLVQTAHDGIFTIFTSDLEKVRSTLLAAVTNGKEPIKVMAKKYAETVTSMALRYAYKPLCMQGCHFSSSDAMNACFGDRDGIFWVYKFDSDSAEWSRMDGFAHKRATRPITHITFLRNDKHVFILM